MDSDINLEFFLALIASDGTFKICASLSRAAVERFNLSMPYGPGPMDAIHHMI